MTLAIQASITMGIALICVFVLGVEFGKSHEKYKRKILLKENLKKLETEYKKGGMYNKYGNQI